MRGMQEYLGTGKLPPFHYQNKIKGEAEAWFMAGARCLAPLLGRE